MGGIARLAADAARGAVATVAMSSFMVAGDRARLMGEQPPTVITRYALREAGVEQPAQAASLMAPLTHLGFGAAGGMLYGTMRRHIPGVPGALFGLAFGLVIYAVSYKGWIPAMGILPAPEDDRPGRPAVMLVAHVVYGLALGWLIPRS